MCRSCSDPDEQTDGFKKDLFEKQIGRLNLGCNNEEWRVVLLGVTLLLLWMEMSLVWVKHEIL